MTILDDDPAWTLLQALAPEACAANPDIARGLAEAAGGLPLALELLGGYLAGAAGTLDAQMFPDLTGAALDELGDPSRRLALAQERLGSGGDAVTLQETIALSLADLPPETAAAFHSLGAFAPKPAHFSREAAEAVTGAGAERLAVLAARNLVEVVGRAFTLHQVLADVARTGMAAEAMARHQGYYLDVVNRDREDWQTIEAVYEQVKWAWEGVGDEWRHEWVGALQVYQGRRGLRLDEIAWIEAGLAIVRRQGERKDEGTLLNNIGLVYDALGQRDKALDYYHQALPIREEVGDRYGMATTLTNIGAVYDALGQRDKALDYLRQALPIMEEVGDRSGLATTLINIGAVYNALGQRDKALDYYQQALTIWEEVGDRSGLATTLNNIGGVYRNLGQNDIALDYFQQALPIREEVGDRYGESVTRYNMAMIYRAQGRLQEAVTELRRVVDLDRQVQHPELESDLAMLAEVEAELARGGGE